MIAKKPRTALYALLIVIAVTIFAVGCTFTQASEATQRTDPPTTEPLVEVVVSSMPKPGEEDVLMDPLFAVQRAGEELSAAAEQAVLERLDPGEELVSCETKILTRQWYYHTLCQTDYELETADGTKNGTLFSMWYPYINGNYSKQMLLACDTNLAFLTGQWWRDRLLPEPTAEYPDFIYLPHTDSHGVITALPQDRPIYCAVRGEVEFWLHYRLWTMFPGEGAEAWLTDNVPVDLGREQGYYVYRLEYYIADHDQVYAFRDYLVIQRQTDQASHGKDWIFHGILTEDELRTYGIDPTTIQEAEPAPYVDDCR